MMRGDIQPTDKLILSVNLPREKYAEVTTLLPSVLSIFNRVFMKGQPVLGRVDWGAVTVYCWGSQYHEFCDALRKANRQDVATYGIHIAHHDRDRWPGYPIDATGELRAWADGINHAKAVKLERENTELRMRIERIQNAVLTVVPGSEFAT